MTGQLERDEKQGNAGDDSDADAFAILAALLILFFALGFYLNS